MRHAITLVRLHGEEEFRVHSNREVPVHVQIAEFKKFANGRTHPEIAEVEIWYSDSAPRRSAKFSIPAPETSEQEEESGDDSEESQDAGTSAESESRRGFFPEAEDQGGTIAV